MTSDSYIGQIMLVAFGFAPEGWAFCDGKELDKNKYPKLYDKIGVNFDPKREKLLLPDLRNRTPIGAGNEYGIADAYGAEEISIEIKNLPSHNHYPQLTVSSSPSTNAIPQTGDSLGVVGAQLGRTFVAQNAYSKIGGGDKLSQETISSTVVGEGKPFNVMQPYLSMQYIIRIE